MSSRRKIPPNLKNALWELRKWVENIEIAASMVKPGGEEFLYVWYLGVLCQRVPARRRRNRNGGRGRGCRRRGRGWPPEDLCRGLGGLQLLQLERRTFLLILNHVVQDGWQNSVRVEVKLNCKWNDGWAFDKWIATRDSFKLPIMFKLFWDVIVSELRKFQKVRFKFSSLRWNQIRVLFIGKNWISIAAQLSNELLSVGSKSRHTEWHI